MRKFTHRRTRLHLACGLLAGAAWMSPTDAFAQNVVERSTTTLLDFGANWRYLHPTTAINPAVADTDFDDTWFKDDGSYNGPAFSAPAPSVLGYGAIDLRPVVTNIGTPASGSRFSAYFITTFTLPGNPTDFSSLVADVLMDDGGFVYLNGQLVSTHNMPGGALDRYTTLAASANFGGGETEDAVFPLTIAASALRPGVNFLAVSVHNSVATSSDLALDLRLSGVSTVPVTADARRQDLIPLASTWKYLDTGVDPGVTWRNLAFDDGLWRSGVGELGYAQPGTQTTIRFGPNENNALNDANNKIPTYLFRKTINLPAGSDPSKFQDLILDLKRDDGAAVYLNGQRVVLDNLADGAPFSGLAPIAATDDGQDIQRFHLNPALLQVGDNILAVEVHQNSATSSDLTFDARLTVVADPLTLVINTISGKTTLMNNSGLAATIDGYAVTSPTTGTFDPSKWRSFADLQLAGPPGSDILGPGSQWDELNPSSRQLAEFALIGQSNIFSGFELSLGRPFQYGSEETVAFEFLPVGAADALPGRVLYVSTIDLPGDLNFDEIVDVQDIDLLCDWLNNPGGRPAYAQALELTGDGMLTTADLDHLIRVILNTEYGDATLDGRVSIGDLTVLAENFGLEVGGTWSMGDFNCDGRLSIGDLTLLAEHFGFDNNPPAFIAVPLPPAAWAGLGLMVMAMRRRRAS